MLLMCALGAGCARENGAAGGSDTTGDGGTGGDLGGGDDAAAVTDSGLSGPLTIQPADPVLLVQTGAATPTATFSALVGGQSVPAYFTIDRGELGVLVAGSGLFTPAQIAGKGTVSASWNGLTAKTTVTVRLELTQKGDPAYTGQPQTGGSGGYGGVGGDGPGGPASSAQETALSGTPSVDAAVKLLYPYDGTVFPRGLFAPLLMWNPGGHDLDAVKVELTTKSGNYHYVGTFARPAGATTFDNLVLPQATWDQLGYSASGEEVTVSLTFAEGTSAFGPYVRKWLIAPATLKGTVYYNSYGTNLVQNSNDNALDKKKYGAATLAIRPGEPDPIVIAGSNAEGCRVCHTVSATGNRLVTQHGENYKISTLVDLNNLGQASKDLSQQNVNFSAISPDGTLLFSDSSSMVNSEPTHSVLYDLTAATPGTALSGVQDLPADLRAGLPSFSPDGKHITFNFYAGAGGGDGKSLGIIDFDQANLKFSNLRSVYTPPSGSVVWPSYSPTTKLIVFENEISSSEWGFTRNGAKGKLWWADLTQSPVAAAALDKLNGTGYLPVTADVPGAEAGHDDDTVFNYEPTVNPIASGGYVWVVFTSRRMYGNVATLAPTKSDPRKYDFRNLDNYTPKKLWVAAIDLNPAPGADPSHPAFYLPGQELRAGNSRGFWTTVPCQEDGTPNCQSGDECCGGYCQPSGDGGLACTSTPPVCSNPSEKCVVDSDCCPVIEGPTACVGGYCALSSPPIL